MIVTDCFSSLHSKSSLRGERGACSVENDSSYKTKALHTRIVSGSAMLLAGAGLTAAINLTYNVVVAFFLGPAGFAHATVVYTVLTILSAVALAFQIVSAKLVAQQKLFEARARVLSRVPSRGMGVRPADGAGSSAFSGSDSRLSAPSGPNPRRIAGDRYSILCSAGHAAAVGLKERIDFAGLP